MAFRIEDYFILKSVNPSSLQESNLIQFAYKSPRGVHDTNPVILVHEKMSDRIYGINTHYDPNVLDQAMKNLEDRILPYLEKEYFKKYPDNKKKLNEERKKFEKSLITETEYHEFMRSYPKKELEVFNVSNKDMSAMRCYKFDRMNSVSRLVFKT